MGGPLFALWCADSLLAGTANTAPALTLRGIGAARVRRVYLQLTER
jgi:hypothetical protein